MSPGAIIGSIAFPLQYSSAAPWLPVPPGVNVIFHAGAADTLLVVDPDVARMGKRGDWETWGLTERSLIGCEACGTLGSGGCR